MSLYEIGRVCIKIAGRDAGKKCVVVSKVDDIFVLVDGETRRRKVNVKHLEPSAEMVDIKENADTAAVAKALGIEVKEKKSKTPAKRPTKPRKVKVKAPVKKTKPVKEKKAPKAKAPETKLEKAVEE
ncbi:MAG: 50S ribosomal protein L14e [Nanoarchaeota archaeon]|nr:50S ribosomal protein L14e [Nanoarchaeota archaeon]